MILKRVNSLKYIVSIMYHAGILYNNAQSDSHAYGPTGEVSPLNHPNIGVYY